MPQKPPDEAIKLGQYQEGRSLTVTELLAEMREKFTPFTPEAFSTAMLNERFVNGQQFVEIDVNTGVVAPSVWGTNVPKVSLNLLRNLVLTRGARVTQGLPNIKPWGDTPGADVGKAQAAETVLTYYDQKFGWDNLIKKAAFLAQPHTCIFGKVTWDVGAGQPSEGVPLIDPLTESAPGAGDGVQMVDPKTGEPLWEVEPGTRLGDVNFELVTLFHVGTDGSERVEDSQYCWFTKYTDIHTARMLLRKVGIKEEPQLETYTTVYGQECSGVEVVDMWHLPTGRIPGGLFALVVGGKVVQKMDFPYIVPGYPPELPVSQWKIGDKSDSPHGVSHVTDAVPLQRTLNELLSTKAKHNREVANGTKLLCHSNIAKAMGAGNMIISVDDYAMAEAVKYLQPNAPPGLDNDIAQVKADINDTFGVNDAVATGGDPRSTKSARQLQYISELDAQKLSMEKSNLDAFMLRIKRQILRRFQQYKKSPEVLKIIGPDNVLQGKALMGADVDGTDLRLEPASGVDMLHAGIAGDADAQMALVGPTPALVEQRDTGLVGGAQQSMQRGQLQQQIQAAIAGQPQQPLPGIDPAFAVAEITQSWGYFPPASHQALLALLMAYQQAGQQSQAAQQAPEAGGGMRPRPSAIQQPPATVAGSGPPP